MKEFNLETCLADWEAAQRKPSLMELWGYEYGQRLVEIAQDVMVVDEELIDSMTKDAEVKRQIQGITFFTAMKSVLRKRLLHQPVSLSRRESGAGI